MISTLLLFGASGDLAGRLLVPALASLHADGELADGFRLIGSGPQAWTDTDFQAHLRERLDRHADLVPAGAREALVAGATFRQADVTDPTAVAAVVTDAAEGSDARPVAVYLALPTPVLAAAIQGISRCALPAGSRIAVEKPFGSDLTSALALNAILATIADRTDRTDRADAESTDGLTTYRVDHVLGLPGVRGLSPITDAAGTRVWDRTDIVRLEVLWEETLALEGRAAFFDAVGALRDVLQNHLLQLACVALAQPSAIDSADSTAQRRAEAMAAVRPVGRADAPYVTRRARYLSGRLAETGGADGSTVPDYAAEPGVDPARGTETYAEVRLRVHSDRWRDLELVLRAGKALQQRRRGVRVVFAPGSETTNLWIDMDELPAGRGTPSISQVSGMEATAYVNVLHDLLSGGHALSVGEAESEAAWRIVSGVLDAWHADEVELQSYPAGSAGPP